MLRQWLYGAALFLGSAGGMIVEIAAGRMIAPYVGMSLYTWTAIIAVVLAGFSAGHWIGGMLAGPKVSRQMAEWRVAVSFAASAVTALASILLLRALADWLTSSGLGTVGLIVALAGGAFLLPSLAVGVVSPLLTKAAVDSQPERTGPIIGRMFALGALGSIFGTLISGYVFISWVGSLGTIWVVSGLYALLAIQMAVMARRWPVVLPGLGAALIAIALPGYALGNFKSPCTTESDYYCIRIDDFSERAGRESRLMVLDHLAHSINDKADPGLLYSPYVHAVDELYTMRTDKQRPQSAFFIGGGGFSLPRAWASQGEGGRYVVAEIDPMVTQMAAASMWLDPNAPGLEIVHRDARMALSRLPAEGQFEVIFGDAFHDISIPAHLVSQEFARLVAERLSPVGLYVTNVVDRGSDPRFLFSYAKTLATVFPVVEVWVERAEIGNKGRVTFIVAAGHKPSPAGALYSQSGIEREWRRWPDSLIRDRWGDDDFPVLTDNFAPVDRLLSSLLTDTPD